jgi:hypothetical protein
MVKPMGGKQTLWFRVACGSQMLDIRGMPSMAPAGIPGVPDVKATAGTARVPQLSSSHRGPCNRDAGACPAGNEKPR